MAAAVAAPSVGLHLPRPNSCQIVALPKRRAKGWRCCSGSELPHSVRPPGGDIQRSPPVGRDWLKLMLLLLRWRWRIPSPVPTPRLGAVVPRSFFRSARKELCCCQRGCFCFAACIESTFLAVEMAPVANLPCLCVPLWCLGQPCCHWARGDAGDAGQGSVLLCILRNKTKLPAGMGRGGNTSGWRKVAGQKRC